MKRWVFGIALALAATGAWAQSIVNLDYVRQTVTRGALLWDVRDAEAFAKGHIPGAVNLSDPTLALRNIYGSSPYSGVDVEGRRWPLQT